LIKENAFPCRRAYFVLAVLLLAGFSYAAGEGVHIHYDNAVDLFNRQAYRSAIDEIELEVRQNPTDLKSYLLMGRAFLELKRYRDGLESIFPAMERYPDETELQNLAKELFAGWEKSDAKGLDPDPFYLQVARWRAGKKDYDKAIEYYKKYLADIPSDSKVQLEYDRVRVWSQENPPAGKEREKIQPSDYAGEPVHTHYNNAVDLYNHQAFLGAIAEAEKEIKENPAHLKSYLLVAKTYLELKKYHEGLNSIIPAIERFPDEPESQKLLNSLLLEWEKSDAKGVDLDPYYLQIARGFSRQKNYPKSLAYYEKYLQDNPSDTRIWLEHARVLSWAKQYSPAISQYKTYLAKFPRDYDALLELTNIYYWKGDNYEAMVNAKKLLEHDPSNITALLIIANIYEQDGKYTAAEAEFEKVLAINRNNNDAIAAMKRMKTRQKEADDWNNSEGLKRIIKKTKDYHYYLNLANALYNEGQKEEAFKYYRLYVEKFPDNYEVRLKLARSLSWEGENDEALTAYRFYLKKYPDQYLVRLEMAKIMFQKDQYAETLKELDKIQARDPDLIDVYVIRGNIYKFSGEYKKALESYRHVIKLSPFNQDATQSITDIEAKFNPEVFARYSSLYSSSVEFHLYGFDVGGRMYFNDGWLVLTAGSKQGGLLQTFPDGIQYGIQYKGYYISAEDTVNEKWKISGQLAYEDIESYTAELHLTLGTELQLSPSANLSLEYSNFNGVYEVNDMYALLRGVSFDTDNFTFNLAYKISKDDDFSALYSEGYYGDGNTRQKVSAGVMHKVYDVPDVPVIRVGGEFDYLSFSKPASGFTTISTTTSTTTTTDPLGYVTSVTSTEISTVRTSYYWAPMPYSEICVVGTATSKDNNSPFFYFVKAKICQVLEAPQMEYSLEGNGTYYFSKNLSAEAAMGFGRAFYAGNNSVFASFLLGVRYQFEN